MDVFELKETQRVPVGKHPFSVAVGPQGNIFVVESGDATLSMLSPDFQELASMKVGKGAIDVTLSKNGDYAYVTAEKASRLYVLKVQ